MTEYLEVEGGRIAYEVYLRVRWLCCCLAWASNATSTGRWPCSSPRRATGWLPADLRGHGESSTGWSSYTRTDTAADTLALIRHLALVPLVVAGHSFSGRFRYHRGGAGPGPGQARWWRSARSPGCRTGSLGALLRNSRYRKGTWLLLATGLTGNAWLPGHVTSTMPFRSKPAGYNELISALQANLSEPGRMAATRKMGRSPGPPTPRPSWAASGARPWWSWAPSTRTGPTRAPRRMPSSPRCWARPRGNDRQGRALPARHSSPTRLRRRCCRS